ncbi:hypothetical protein PsYK624_161040 [Phanerochaete sordida]|uniref:Oxidoreductase AflY n=1 Tax=Phanerochaete sordida TaxID=48140 RepID=A0A9P3GRI0_9APHY|nr:hypothetical protein PsYK624_161040 [Phanerochaete sordida]
MDASSEQLNLRFPTPSSPPVSIVPHPAVHPGFTHESTKAVLDCLKDNHKRFHIFFNERGFHNHCSHHLLAIYAMGASPEVIRAAYETHVAYQRPAFPSTETTEAKDSVIITESNWKDYLGDERYYQAYVAFFSRLLLSGMDNALQSVMHDYVFSTNANLVPGKSGKKPLMLSRFHTAVLHPLIHAGYGAEFGLPGLAAEGLAQTAIHGTDAPAIFTHEFFGASSSSTSGLVSMLSSLSVFGTPGAKPGVQQDVHALSILARASKEAAFEPQNLGLPLPREQLAQCIDLVVERGGPKLLEYIDEWAKTVVPDASVLKKKFEEIIWMNTVIYAVAGWGGRKKCDDETHRFNGDFFYMHLVTSALMMAPLLNSVSANNAVLLLRTYFIFSLVLYLGRGRPALPVGSFYASAAPYPSVPGPAAPTAKATLEPSATPNPWLPIVQSTLVHPNEHLCKAQRALMHFAQCLGGVEAGAFAECGLEGAEHLDGTLFARAAALTADRLGWMREGEEQRAWDFNGFF